MSHHGHKEFGAPVEPMTIEAMILSAADDLDAKINQVRQALAEDGDGEFTAYHSRLGRVLWRGLGFATGLRAGPLLAHCAAPVLAQEESGASTFGKVLLGGVAGFGLHEGGHLVANWAFEEKVRIKKVDYKGIPFFALSHAPDLSPRREYVVSSAGFWAQYLYSEQILTHHPESEERAEPVPQGDAHFSRRHIACVFGRGVRKDGTGRARHARDGDVDDASTSAGSARWCSRPRSSICTAISTRMHAGRPGRRAASKMGSVALCDQSS